MTREEIDQKVQEKLDAISPEEMEAFFNSFDDPDPTEQEAPIPTFRPEVIAKGVAELAQQGKIVSMTPINDAETNKRAMHALAESIAASYPGEDAEDIERQLLPTIDGDPFKSAEQKIVDAIAKLAAKHKASPNPFAVARNGLNAAEEEANRHFFARDPIAVMPLVCDLLGVNACIEVKTKVRFKSGNTQPTSYWLDSPVAKQKSELVNALNHFMLASASLAKLIGSSALDTWKLAIDFVWRKSRIGHDGKFAPNGTARGWTKKETDELARLIDKARGEAHVDYAILAYANDRKEVAQ